MYDPFAGGDFQTGTVDTIYGGADRSIGNPPNNATNDWLCLVTSGTLKKTGPFLEEDGLLIIEMESTDSPLGLWIEKTDVPGYTGTCHFEFTGNNPSSGPPNSPLSYTFKINMTGNYHLNLRARKRLEGQPADRCNDCYVKMEGDFTSGNPAYPTSTLTQNTKLYGGAANGWGWATNLDGNGAHNTDAAIYNLKAGETYTLTISGRSQRFNLDRIVLRHSSVSNEDARDPSRPESRRGSSPATPPPPVNHLILNAISFPVLLVDGFVPYYIDSELFTNYQIDRKVLRIIK